MAWTTPVTTFVVNEVLTAGEMNAIGENLLVLYQTPMTMAVPTESSSQTIGSDSQATLTLGTAQYDPGGFWQTGSSEFLCPVAADYGVIGGLGYSVADTGVIGIQIVHNEAIWQEKELLATSGLDPTPSDQIVGTVPGCASGDTIEIVVTNNTTGDLTVTINGTQTYCHVFVRSFS